MSEIEAIGNMLITEKFLSRMALNFTEEGRNVRISRRIS